MKKARSGRRTSEPRVTQKQLDGWAAKWCRILRLEDWEVEVSIHRGVDMPDACGECHHTIPRKHASIWIADPRDLPAGALPEDTEQTIVHELIHLHVAPFEAKERGSLEDIAQEQMIDALSKAFVELDRRVA